MLFAHKLYKLLLLLLLFWFGFFLVCMYVLGIFHHIVLSGVFQCMHSVPISNALYYYCKAFPEGPQFPLHLKTNWKFFDLLSNFGRSTIYTQDIYTRSLSVCVCVTKFNLAYGVFSNNELCYVMQRNMPRVSNANDWGWWDKERKRTGEWWGAWYVCISLLHSGKYHSNIYNRYFKHDITHTHTFLINFIQFPFAGDVSSSHPLP